MLTQLFQLLAIGLHSDIQDVTIKDVDWDKMVEIAVRQSVGGQVYSGVKHLKSGDVVNGSIEIEPLDFGMLYTLAEKQEKHFLKMWNSAANLADVFARKNVRMIVIKGYGIASLYPNPKLRFSCDLDCFLADGASPGLIVKDLNSNENAWKAGNAIAEENECAVNTNIYIHSTFEYKGLHVENHRYLTPVKGSRRMMSFERLLRDVLEEEGTTRLGDTNVEIPGLLFTAVYCMYHAQKHLLRFEISLKMVCDWAMIIRKTAKSPDFNWTRFWDVCDTYGMKRFAIAMTGLANDICKVSIPDIKRDLPAESLLKGYIIGPYEGYRRTSSIWKNRVNLIREMIKARKRYAEFTDYNFMTAIISIIKGRFVED